MPMCQFINTVATIIGNRRYLNPYGAVGRHIRWQFRKAANAFPCQVTRRGLTINVTSSVVANGCGGLFNAMGYYDPNNMLLMKELLTSGGYRTVVDVGANIGIYSLIAASCGPSVRVLCFEPHPDTFGLLQGNIRLNGFCGRIEARQSALGASRGTMALTDHPGSSTNRIVAEPGDDDRVMQVEVEDGATMCRSRGLVPDVLKIDVEGFENLVLSGFRDSLDGVKVILVECWDLAQTIGLLCDEHNFVGPFKVDYRQRLLSRTRRSYEDWVFVNERAVADLSDRGIRVD